jgi:hypothetical protein
MFDIEPASSGISGKSFEKIPTMIMQIPNTVIKTEPVVVRNFFGNFKISDNPNKAIIKPAGMKPAKFIKYAFGEPVAPSSLMNWEIWL